MGNLQERLEAAKIKAKEADTGKVSASGASTLSDRLAAAKTKAAEQDAVTAAPKSADAAAPIIQAANRKKGSIWSVTPEEAAGAEGNTQADTGDIAGSWARWLELANKASLTPEEKTEAKAAVKELNSAAGDLRGFWGQGSGADKQKANEYDALAAMLHNKSSVGASVAAGAISAVPFAGTAVNKAIKASTSDEVLNGIYQDNALKAALRGNNSMVDAQKANPLAYAAGNIGMNIGMLTMASGAAQGITSGITGFSKLAPWIKNAINSAISFGAVSGLGAADDYLGEGATAGDKALHVLKNTAVGAAGGAAGGALATVVSGQAMKVLFKYGLQNDVMPVAIASGLTGAGFAAGNTGVQELAKALEYREDYVPNVKEIGTNLLIGFGFGVVQSVIESSKVSAANKKWMQEQYDSLVNGYKKAEFTMAGMSSADRVKAASETLNRIDALRTGLNTTQIVGGGKEIREVQAYLDMIEGEMMGIISTYQQTALGSGTASVAAGTGMQPATGSGTPATQGQQTATPAEAAAIPLTGVQGPQTASPVTGTDAAAKGAAGPEKNGQSGLFIDERTYDDVSSRKVNAFQFDNPELHGHFAEAAHSLTTILDESTKGERGGVFDADGYQTGSWGVKRETTAEIERLKDNANLTYAQIRKALQDIVANHGQENYAAAKKVELVLDDMMTNGYSDMRGETYEPDEAYIAKKEAIKNSATGGETELTPSAAGDVAEQEAGKEALPLYNEPEAARIAQQNGVARETGTGYDETNGAQEEQQTALQAAMRASEPQTAAADNERGGTLNVRAEEGTGALSGGDGGRVSGVGTGGQDGVLAKGTKGAKPRANQGRTAIERQNRVIGLRREKVSTRSLGLPNGTDNAIVTTIPPETYDEELRAVAQRLEKDGWDATFFTGSLQITDAAGEPHLVRGANVGSQIFVRADGITNTVSQIADHEMFHGIAAEDPGLVATIEQRIRERYTEQEFDAIVQKYIEKYRGIYGTDDMRLMLEEVFADAFAGINSFGTNATKYSDEVRGTVRERRGPKDTAQGMEPVRGPPEEAGKGKNSDAIGLPGMEPEETAPAREGESRKTTGDTLAKYSPEEGDDGGSAGGSLAVDSDGREASMQEQTDDGRDKSDLEQYYWQKNTDLANKIRDNLWKTETAAFKSWFADSKAINTSGGPLLVFHGAGAGFTKFDSGGSPIWFSPNVMYAKQYGDYLNRAERMLPFSKIYGEPDTKLIPAYIRVENPANIGSTDGHFEAAANRLANDLDIPLNEWMDVWEATGKQEKTWETINTPDAVELLKKYGYDGIFAVENGTNTYSVFDGTQVKSAIANSGKYKTEQKDIRYSAEEGDELKAPEDERKSNKYVQKLREDFGLKLPGTEEGPKTNIPEGMTADEYMNAQHEKAMAAKAERMRIIPKEEFYGTPETEKLKFRVEGSVTDYAFVESLIGADKGAKSIQRELKKTERRLKPTEAEKEFASGIAAGLYDENDIPDMMDSEKVMELADDYMTERGQGEDMIRQRRQDINRAIDEKVEEDFKDSEEYNPAKFGKFSKFIMNERTPERIMKSIFGAEKGAKLFNDYFWTVETNEAERYRFVNQMLNEMRNFEDSNGKLRQLTNEENVLAQKVEEGRAVQEIVAGMEMKEAIKSAAHNIRNGEDTGDSAREFSLNTEEKEMAKNYARWMETQEQMESGSVDTVIIENAVKKFAEKYNDFYAAINVFLVAHGYETIGFIKGYAPHMQTEDTQNLLHKTLEKLGINTEIVKSLPASIAGNTADRKPNMRYDPYFQTRTSDLTEYHMTKGYESYVNFLSDVLYHTDDIMRLRRVSNYLRRTYAPEEISIKIEQAEGLRDATRAEKTVMLREAKVVQSTAGLNANDVNKLMDNYIGELYTNIINMSKYSEFVTWLDNYTNIQAGKQSLADRGLEYSGGREFLNVGNKLMRAFSRANVGGNISSMINQTAQLALIKQHLGIKYTIHAIGDIATGKVRRASFVEKSDFLTGKDGIDWITYDNFEKFINILFTPASVVDMTVSKIAVRGEYLKAINEGLSDKESMKRADAFGRRVMGSRMKGTKPQGFESKEFVSQMIHIFQLEAANSFDYTFLSDLPEEIKQTFKDKGKAAGFRRLAAAIVGYLLTAFILNRLTEELNGSTPAPFDIAGLTASFFASGEGLPTNVWLRTIIDNGWEHMNGERLFDTQKLDPERKFNWSAASSSLGYNAINDVPYVQNVAGMLGLGDETLPTVGINEIGEEIQSAWKALFGDDANPGEAAEHLFYAATQLLPGGRQLKKTEQGLKTMAQGGRVYGYGDKERLQYPVGSSWSDWLQAALFGNQGIPETEKFYASDLTGLSAKQTDLYNGLVDGGAERNTVYDAIQGLRAIEANESLTSSERSREKRDLIQMADLTDEEKAKLYSGMISDGRDDEFSAMMGAGMTWDETMDAYNQYARINDLEDITAPEKATELAKWVDDQTGYTDEQQQLIKDELVFYSIIPAEAERYSGLTGAGLSNEAAYDLTTAFGALEPEDGKEAVSSMQRYRVVAESGLSDDDQMKALSTLMEETEYFRVETGYSYGVRPAQYIQAKQLINEINYNGSVTQDEATAAINKMLGLTSTQKAVLWQMQNKSWNAGHNPYSTSVGAKIRAILQKGSSGGLGAKKDGSGLKGLTLPGIED